MISYYFFELKYFIRSKKNIALTVLLLVATLYYSIFVTPNYQPNESINEDEIRQEYEEMSHWLDNIQGDGISEGSVFALNYFPPLVEINSNRLRSLETQDFNSYVSSSAEWYTYQDEWIYIYPDYLSYNSAYYGIDQQYPRQEGRYWYLETSNRYNSYEEYLDNITPSIIEERTALQTGYRVLNSSILPVIYIGLVVVFSNDILIKDKNHLSIVQSFPLSVTKKLVVKTAVVLTASLTITIILFTLGLLIIGINEGIGHLSIPVSSFTGPLLVAENYKTISIGLFYVQSLILLILIAYVFTRFILITSLLFRNEYFNLIIGFALIFTESFYYMRGIGYFSNLDLLPFAFFPVGQVLSGYQNHLYNSSMISFNNGLLSLAITILFIELLLFVLSNIKAVRYHT